MNDEKDRYKSLARKNFNVYLENPVITELPLSSDQCSVVKVNLSYPTGESIDFVKKSYFKENYGEYDNFKIKKEIDLYKLISDYFRKERGINALPLIYNIDKGDSMRDTVFYMQDMGNCSLMNIYTNLSPKAQKIKKELSDGRKMPCNSIEEKLVDELNGNRLIEISEDGFVGLKRNIVKYLQKHPEMGTIYKSQKVQDFRNALELIITFDEEVNKLYLNPGEKGIKLRKRMKESDENIEIEFTRILERLNPNKDHGEMISIFNELYNPRISALKPKLIHGDCNAMNIIKSDNGYKGFSLIDVDHINFSNPLVDVADYISFCEKFCGMEKDLSDELWEKSFIRHHVRDQDLRLMVSFYRDLKAYAAITKKIQNFKKDEKNKYAIESTDFRKQKYLGSVEDYLNGNGNLVNFKKNEIGLLKKFLKNLKTDYVENSKN